MYAFLFLLTIFVCFVVVGWSFYCVLACIRWATMRDEHPDYELPSNSVTVNAESLVTHARDAQIVPTLEPLEPRTLASGNPIAPVDLSPHSLVMGPNLPAIVVGSKATAPGQNKQPPMPPPITPVLPPTPKIVTLADAAGFVAGTPFDASYTLWGDGDFPLPSDPKQTNFQDCWLKGSELAMAQGDPWKLMNEIRPDGKGGYYIQVSATLIYEISGDFDYRLTPGPNHALWDIVLEQYEADLHGSMDYLGPGWMSGFIFDCGWTAENITIPTTPEGLAAVIDNAKEKAEGLTLATGSSPTLVSSHCYMLSSYTVADGVYTFYLKNPWNLSWADAYVQWASGTPAASTPFGDGEIYSQLVGAL